MVYGFASVALMVLELERMQEHLSGWINATAALVDAAAAVFLLQRAQVSLLRLCSRHQCLGL